MADELKLGLVLGYWFAGPPVGRGRADRGRRGARVRLGLDGRGLRLGLLHARWPGTARDHERCSSAPPSCQISARTPAATAMTALTLDHLSGGRFILGLGASGPQVVEGWYGQPYPKPLARTREYVEIIRQILAREEPLDFQGEHYQLPHRGEGTTGLGKPLKSITHPRRADLPIYLGAEGPKNVALAAEIADGWLPIFLSPKLDALLPRRAWPRASPAPAPAARLDDFEIPNLVQRRDRRRRRGGGRPRAHVARLLHRRHGRPGGQLPRRRVRPHGLRGARSSKIQDLFLAGRKDEAIAVGAAGAGRGRRPRRPDRQDPRASSRPGGADVAMTTMLVQRQPRAL